MHLSRHKQKRTHPAPKSRTFSSSGQHGSSSEFTQVPSRVHFRGGNRFPERRRETTPYTPYSLRTSHPKQSKPFIPSTQNTNSFAIGLDDSESEDEPQETPQEPSKEPIAPTPPTHVVNPVDILVPFTKSMRYPVEAIEGLVLLGMIQVPPLDETVQRTLEEYTKKCKQIHQQYATNYKRGPRGHNSSHTRSHPHHHPQKRRHPPKPKKQELTGDDFAAIRDFKKTELKRDIEGVAKTKAKIRAHLNKLTDKTYTKILAQIKEEMNTLIHDGANEEDYSELSRFLFDVASGNRFYGYLYADLFHEMVQEYTFLKDAMNKQLEVFTKTMVHVETACPDTEYDKFCEVNKKNEQRRSLAAFMGHLLRIECIHGDTIGDAIYGLITQSISWIRMKEGDLTQNRVCVEEMAEVVYAFLKASGIHALDLNMWEPLFKNCLAITEMKREKGQALTAKAKFKYMDILDMITKWTVE